VIFDAHDVIIILQRFPGVACSQSSLDNCLHLHWLMVVHFNWQQPLERICLIPELCFLTGLTDELRKDFRVMKVCECCIYQSVDSSSRMHTNPGKSWNLKLKLSRPGRSWNRA